MRDLVDPLPYRPEIDGLRAVAVICVVLYHAHLGFTGGFVGVDVFFVISGYLITGLLRRWMSSGQFRAVDFWERRIRRLVPALAVVTFVTAMLGMLILVPTDLEDMGGALLAQPLLMANIYFYRVVDWGYPGDSPEMRPMLHSWSLGLEEQFYLLYPLLLSLLLRRPALARHLGKVLALLATVSLISSLALPAEENRLNFFCLPFRAWEFLLGGLLGFVAGPTSRLAREVLSAAGLATIVLCALVYDSATPFPGLGALPPCLGTALVIWASEGGPQTVTGRGLAHPIMKWLGKISYSWYLWHWPVIAYASYLGWISAPETRWALVLASCWLGHLSWKFIEGPWRASSAAPGRGAVGILLLGYSAMCLGFGWLFHSSGGLPTNWSAQALRYAGGRQDVQVVREVPLDGTAASQPLNWVGAESAREGSRTFLLWGDSTAMALLPAFQKLGQKHGVMGVFVVQSGTAPVVNWPGLPSQQAEAWSEAAFSAAERSGASTVVIVGRWEWYRREHDIKALLRETVDALQARGLEVVLVLGADSQLYHVPRVLALTDRYPWYKKWRPQPDREWYLFENFLVKELVPQSVRILEPATYLTTETDSVEEAGGFSLYRDPGHLSVKGAEWLTPMLEPLFEDLADPLDSTQAPE